MNGGVLSNRDTGRCRTGPGLVGDGGNRVGVTIPQIHSLSNPPLQSVPCGQVHCPEATGCG